ncbi:hypothetical protein H072_568 [Dactylellina haptotyla CBS 200.50]|uniref:Uncharacterized protein n=1 Tax=Dactylellina haptotyla (strain CBS 200.50) TaxID=1284197 RepID=S8AWQ2_DACHA|nr:hypothetical protein H072_568 [Dactylellina haptotyla CBS 200.50]
MASRRATQKALYGKIVPLWPKDPMRPQVDFPAFLERRLESDFGDAPQPKVNDWPEINDGSKRPIFAYSDEPASFEKQWAVLNGLIANKYQKKYPVKKLTEPGFDPDYYKKLIRELDDAPHRNWLSSYINSWRGFIRWEH